MNQYLHAHDDAVRSDDMALKIGFSEANAREELLSWARYDECIQARQSPIATQSEGDSSHIDGENKTDGNWGTHW